MLALLTRYMHVSVGGIPTHVTHDTKVLREPDAFWVRQGAQTCKWDVALLLWGLYNACFPACRTYLIATRFWVVVICPIIKCHTVFEFSFILFDLCLFITTFNFILNYVPIVTFWIFTYHKIWILLIIFCFIWNYWIIYFQHVWKCFGVLWVNWCQFAVDLANKVKMGLAF